ncbi:MAG TPA: hypothetical protein VK010_01110 [Flavobacteriaceae bacterium]|nr:hypothetical protein [Flavobacteriaceae bacterium]
MISQNAQKALEFPKTENGMPIRVFSASFMKSPVYERSVDKCRARFYGGCRLFVKPDLFYKILFLRGIP